MEVEYIVALLVIGLFVLVWLSLDERTELGFKLIGGAIWIVLMIALTVSGVRF